MILPSQHPTLKELFSFYETSVRPLLNEFATQSVDGYHGIDTHTYNVVFRALDYALKLKQNPMPVLFAAALHDIARTNDDYDTRHGPNAVSKAKPLLERFSDLLTPPQQKAILKAICLHTKGENPDDYISACLWDADRTRLSWTRGYDERFFATAYAKKVASLPNPAVYLRYQAMVLKRPVEDREAILFQRSFMRKDILLQHLKQKLSRI